MNRHFDRRWPLRSILSAFSAAALLSGAMAAGNPDDEAAYFRSRIEPLLKTHCFECHSHAGGKAKGGLVLDSRSGWTKGGDSGPAIAPGKPGESLLARAIGYADADLQMPPDGKLPPETIALLRDWIARGAPDPRESFSPEDAGKSRPAVPAAAELWSFQPLKPVAPPEVRDAGWPRDPFDRFLLAKLESEGITPAPDADAWTLARRLYLVLTGLPPTPEQSDAFRAAHERDPDAAVADLADRLLASPAFGEKWARHWLDLTAYADTIGLGRAIPAPEAWRYRDYAIGAFSGDQPFPEFVREQLAGDLLESSDAAMRARRIVATGFLAIGPWELVNGDKAQLRMDVIDRQVQRTGQALLGMTLGCARCHDHKFDPVTQAEYYGLAGIFYSTVTLNGRLNGVFSAIEERPLPETPEQLVARAEAARVFQKEVSEAESRRSDARAEAKALEEKIAARKAELATASTTAPANSGAETADTALSELQKQLDEANGRVREGDGRLKVLAYLRPHRIEALAMSVSEMPEPEDCRINIRGNARQLGEVAPRGFPRGPAWDGAPVAPSAGQSGRRELADWIVDPKNPLAARVWVNRVWRQVFGEGLVRTADNFGFRGEAPSHPELLDRLAADFIADGWSTKRLIRRLVATRAWRQAAVNPAAVASGIEARDPENRWLWRANRRRLDAETIRDAMLAVSGMLSREAGGSSLPLEIPGNLNTGKPESVGDGARFPESLSRRRSVYLPVKRKGPFDAMDFLAVFDLPDTNQENGQRSLTAVPTQALTLANSPFVVECGRALAGRAGGGDDRERAAALVRRVFARPAEPEEIDAALAFLDELSQNPADRPADEARDEAWARLGQSCLIANEFLFRD